MRSRFLILLPLLVMSASAEAKVVQVVTSPVTLDYAGATNCFSVIIGAEAYFVALKRPSWVTADGDGYLSTMKEAHEAFGRIMVWEGMKLSKSRADVERDVDAKKKEAIASLNREQDFPTVLAVYNEQAKVCLKYI